MIEFKTVKKDFEEIMKHNNISNVKILNIVSVNEEQFQIFSNKSYFMIYYNKDEIKHINCSLRIFSKDFIIDLNLNNKNMKLKSCHSSFKVDQFIDFDDSVDFSFLNALCISCIYLDRDHEGNVYFNLFYEGKLNNIKNLFPLDQFKEKITKFLKVKKEYDSFLY